jgi:hypothetical protein
MKPWVFPEKSEAFLDGVKSIDFEWLSAGRS